MSDVDSKVVDQMILSREPITDRVRFDNYKPVVEHPDLVQHQRNSFDWLVTAGLGELFSEVNPIDDYTGEKLSLRILGYEFSEPKTTEAEARANGGSYEASLHCEVELTNKITGEVSQQKIYFGDYPWITSTGSFLVNGTERVVVSQLIRSPGVFFTANPGLTGNLYGAKLMPSRGSWLEFETAANGAIFVKIDRKRKIAATTLLRAFGFASNKKIKDIFADVDNGKISYIDATLEKDTAASTAEALIEVFRKIRPGDLATVENAKSLIENMFFNFKRFDFSRVGRYKVNKRLGLDVENTVENRTMRIEDITALISEIIRLNNSQEPADDIDSLSNRRVKMVGELIQRQFRIGILRMERNIKDRMSLSDIEAVTAQSLINPRPIVASVKDFFSSSQLSQFMDQINPLSELAHKRRLSSMGPGGLSRERAGFEVRDAHSSHYGRVCIVETPEGPNIGLVLNMATYARINDYGFIETPYQKVVKGKVTNDIVWLDADQELEVTIAGSGNEVDKTGKFINDRVEARVAGNPGEVDADAVDLIDASNMQIIGATASLIPFVENNYVYRSLMGSSQQRQSVPLITPRSPLIGTGFERHIALQSGQLIVAEDDGVVEYADANEVRIKYGKSVKTINPYHFVRSNNATSMNQVVVVSTGDKVKKGQPIIQGASIENGELALGKDLRVAFMPWEGYNFEDAIVVSQRLVKDDEMTSIHISDYSVEVRETKLGAEITTRDIPNASDESLRYLDEEGIVAVGAEVKPGDVLVGKITPKGEQELSSEERLLRAIFGEKAKDVRDTSLKISGSKRGKVVGVKVFTREDGHELKSGVLKQIQIFVAELRKIDVGDKLGGRYGNKGVIARVLPEEDMPFSEDGEPIDVILNPLGVPGRMNMGQLFETHLSQVAMALGFRVATPSFKGLEFEQIQDMLESIGHDRDGKVQLIDGRTGEPFINKTTVGYMHLIKLNHMIADKMHARSIGPYTMVTQQPLGGKAQNGGQRFGEMEVWALEAYGAANTLQEMLTIKSDDITGRARAYESIIKQEPILGPELPESFRVLVRELRGLALNVVLMQLREGKLTPADEDTQMLETYSQSPFGRRRETARPEQPNDQVHDEITKSMEDLEKAEMTESPAPEVETPDEENIKVDDTPEEEVVAESPVEEEAETPTNETQEA